MTRKQPARSRKPVKMWALVVNGEYTRIFPARPWGARLDSDYSYIVQIEVPPPQTPEQRKALVSPAPRRRKSP